ncbi:morn motif-containing protein [Planoprotostelium fungivorum]|uniref:Spindle pole body component n=1 Tax=Planoprotostelium fungivorum TaxID=1890364 RepID=A0A2P6N376_9EUKA|nr:morn motif-containing protein [Planoprotostelium fungivorum]
MAGDTRVLYSDGEIALAHIINTNNDLLDESEIRDEVVTLLLGFGDCSTQRRDQLLRGSPSYHRELIEWFFRFEDKIRTITRFITESVTKTESTTKCHQSFASAADHCLSLFRSDVSAAITSDLSLARIRCIMSSQYDIMTTLYDIVCHCQLQQPTAAATTTNLLDRLYLTLQQTCTLGDEMRSSHVMELFILTMEPYVEIMENWIHRGVLNDPFGEFMVQTSDGEDVDGFTLRTDGVPVFLKEISQEILSAGRYHLLSMIMSRKKGMDTEEPEPRNRTFYEEIVDSLRKIDTDEEKFRGNFDHRRWLTGEMSEDSSGRLKDRARVKWCVSIPIEAVVDSTIKRPVLHVHKKISKRVLEWMMADCRMMSHLEALRGLYFMREGFIFHEFLSQLFHKIDTGVELEDVRMTIDFQEISSGSPFFGMESASWTTTTSHSKIDPKSIHSLEALHLHYDAPWPIHLMMTDSMRHNYNRVLILLIQIKRAKHAVDGPHLKGTEKNSTTHAVQMLRKKLVHFTGNLQEYMVNRVLQTSWLEFESSIRDADDFDQVRRLHETYLDNIIENCLLGVKRHIFLKRIREILNLCLRFRRLFDSNGEDRERMSRECHRMDEDFSQAAYFLVAILREMVSQRRIPHLEDLLLRLNMNEFPETTLLSHLTRISYASLTQKGDDDPIRTLGSLSEESDTRNFTRDATLTTVTPKQQTGKITSPRFFRNAADRSEKTVDHGILRLRSIDCAEATPKYVELYTEEGRHFMSIEDKAWMDALQSHGVTDRHGQGKFVWRTGDHYEGEFKNDLQHGRGIYTWSDGSVTRLICLGTYTWAYNGERYEGEFREDKIHGQGTFFYDNGERYEGEYRDGKRHGQGTLFFPSGNRYEGEYRENKRHGRGTHFHANGNRYEGEFRENKRHGQGTIFYANGKRYEGEFKEGKKHGQGTYFYPNGDIYTATLQTKEKTIEGVFFCEERFVVEQLVEIETTWSPPAEKRETKISIHTKMSDPVYNFRPKNGFKFIT